MKQIQLVSCFLGRAEVIPLLWKKSLRHSFTIVSILSLSFYLAACGFRPLYMPIKGTSHIAVPIKIATIKDREGQILRNFLLDLLTPEGSPLCPRYILEITISEIILNIGINLDETVMRKKASVTANLLLKDALTNQIVYTHTATAINSFNILSENYFSDLVAEEYAKKEALQLLAEKITLLLMTFMDANNGNQ